jgi:hypothetical protein
MRTVGKYGAIWLALASLTATSAAAQTMATTPYSFEVKPEPAQTLDLSTDLAPTDAAVPLSLGAARGDVRVLASDRYYPGAGPVTWRSSAVTYQDTAGGPINQIRVTVANVPRIANTAPLSLVRPGGEAYELQDIDVTVTRGWPSVVALAGRKYALDVTPHAGLGFGGAGGSAEAGATVRLGKKRNIGDRVNDALGVREGASAFGDRGRWYIYAAASGRAVGLNMLRGQNGDWTRAGLSQDVTSRLIGDSQAGVAWRKGPMQASLGYIHREIRAKEGILGLATQKDDVVALSFSLKPHW